MRGFLWASVFGLAAIGCTDNNGGTDATMGDSGGTEPDGGVMGLDSGIPFDGALDDGGALGDGGVVGTDASPVGDGCDPDNAGLELVDGLCAGIFADQIQGARHLAFGPNGVLYVALAAEEQPGGIAAISDTDHDGRADRIERFGDGTGGNGIAIYAGALYLAEDGRLIRYPLPDGATVANSPAEIVIDGLPETGDHAAKTIVFDRTHLYMNLGSASNSCQLENRTLESPGEDPCPELAKRAGVWRFPLDAVLRGHLAMTDGERFVTGSRNFNALARNPSDGAIYGVMNGRDQLAEHWPRLYSPADDLVLPSEEFARFAEGQDYGWPYCYYDPTVGHKVLAPEYGGDGQTVGRCATATPPIAVFPAHWAPLGLTFYDRDELDESFRGGAFIAFHGSHFDPNPTGEPPGYSLVFQPMSGSSPSGAFLVVAKGFAGSGRPLPDRALHRPVGVAVGPEGALYVSDDTGGRIYRIARAEIAIPTHR